MSQSESEISDVVVILADVPGMTTAQAVEQLKSAGLNVTDVDENEGVIEGTVATRLITGLKELRFVDYVRSVFNYTTEEGQDADPEESDDAGA